MLEINRLFFSGRLSDKQLQLFGGVFLFFGLVSMTVGVGFLIWKRELYVQSLQREELSGVCPQLPDQKTQVVVNISGAVIKQGLYTLDQGSRLGDLIEMSGGFSSKADAQYVAQELNLAKSLTDGEKVYIPYLSERGLSGNAVKSEADKKAGLVSLNQASKTELESLSGVGEKRAESIIANRPYQTINELVEKKVISETLFLELKDFLML